MKPPVKTKYRSEATIVDGIRFSSKKEARRWGELKLLQKAGLIAGLERQYRYPLHGQEAPILTPTGRQAYYVADFVYEDIEAKAVVIEDAKGFRTPEYKLKRAILAAMGLTIKEV
jgi:hypothetical protein